MTRARSGAALLALALLLGCGEDRATPIRDEIAKLKKERVPADQLDTATVDAAGAEAARDAAVAKADRDEAELAAARAELERLRASLQHEVDRNAELRAQLDAKNGPLAEATAQTDALEKKVAERRKRLGVLRDQAKALARALQPQDPAWAEARRLGALRDFAGDAGSQLPAQPEVQALGRALAQSPPEREMLVTALQKLAEALDRAAEDSGAQAGAK
jgi:DNA repair exonuclease SbcCD ATPase subunit